MSDVSYGNSLSNGIDELTFAGSYEGDVVKDTTTI